jgi:thiosulfate reductase cytochrome b subunit
VSSKGGYRPRISPGFRIRRKIIASVTLHGAVLRSRLSVKFAASFLLMRAFTGHFALRYGNGELRSNVADYLEAQNIYIGHFVAA